MNIRKPEPRFLMAALIATLLACAAPLASADQHKKGETMAGQSEDMQQAVKDAWLDGKLESAYLFNRHLNPFDIDTKVRGGTAYLSGAVDSDILKDLAEEVALAVEGIDKVENQLLVDEQAAKAAGKSAESKEKANWRKAVDNATLTATIKTSLLMNENTSGLDINVDSKDGVVTLSGTVDSAEEADLAEQIAVNAENANKVKNKLKVKKEQ
ncbi:MAG: BON domain-containing protein [Xanthomonadales bacterium]|nr:BON domain-containing protein [Xanthomonadales bacterium]